MSDTPEQEPGEATEARRDFFVTLAGGFAAVGAALAMWPLIDSMNPAADVLASGEPLDIDLSRVEPGRQVVVQWRGLPVFGLRRTPEELKVLSQPQLTALLRDPDSNELQQPSYAKNWHRSIKPEYLVLLGICTHLGCVPQLKPKPGELAQGWFGGYFCPCHGSKYDLSGRVYVGVPAPYNLPVPPYRFVDEARIRIGENPKGFKFDFRAIRQL
jgi:ubiquinol-cytochrome c reductase iron-sulfur subunit